VVADSGSENVNGAVDDSLDGEALTRVLAQVEITFSNSMIEAFWRSLGGEGVMAIRIVRLGSRRGRHDLDLLTGLSHHTNLAIG
jgi:hypothetical protein